MVASGGGGGGGGGGREGGGMCPFCTPLGSGTAGNKCLVKHSEMQIETTTIQDYSSYPS